MHFVTLNWVLLSRVNFFGARDIPDAENLQMYRETAEILHVQAYTRFINSHNQQNQK